MAEDRAITTGHEAHDNLMDGQFEKRASVAGTNDLKDEESSEPDDTITDLFSSFPPLKGVEDEPNPLTVRAVLIGILLGSLVNASNVYLGMSHYAWAGAGAPAPTVQPRNRTATPRCDRGVVIHEMR